jgi:opacity protein-like surface antigen
VKVSKKFFLILVLSILIFSALYAETNVPVTIEKADNWVPKLSPYIINDTVTIEKTGFITIYPGTEIRFKEGAKLIVKGALYAKGDPKNPVRFLPDNGESFYEGIDFQSKYQNTIEFSIMIRGTIKDEGTPLNLSNCYILNSTGVELGHFASGVIKNNYFYNDTYGVYIDGKRVSAEISGNTFNRNKFAVYIKELTQGTAVIKKNNFFGCNINVTNYTPENIDAKDNYWDLPDEAKIGAFIFDKRTNPKVGDVIFKPFSKVKLALFEPPDAFISLVKIYLQLKRPDEEPSKVGFGAGGAYLIPMGPARISKETSYGTGLKAEFVFNLTGAFLLGVEADMLSAANKDKSIYDYNLSMSDFFLNFYAYMGYKQNVFFIPYAKLGPGIGLISEQYKAKNAMPDWGGQTSLKYNDVSFEVQGGLGCELFIIKFFSLKAEALYNTTLRHNMGGITFPIFSLTGSVYFDTPFYYNEK